MSAPALQRRVFLAMAAVLLLSWVTVFFIGLRNLNRAKELAERRAVAQELGDFLSTIKDAETGQRGFLLTGSERYLEPYETALKQAGQRLSRLHDQVERGLLKPGSVAEFERLAAEKMQELAQTVATYRQQGAEAALAIVRTDRGKKVMDRLRMEVGRLIASEDEKVHRLEEEVRRATWQRTLIFGGAALLNLGFIASCYRRLRLEAERTALVAREVGRQKDLLDVTLRSIGDGVIITDVEGRVTFLNPVASALTQRHETEAIGQPCAKVFHIINEATRAVVESPVEKVLRLGTIVGLANHTLLVRPDGTEVPIDDSGAPVREIDGTLRGVVLVFRDFTEHKNAERALIAANQARDRFLATLSHELRTPLTPVLLTASALAEDVTLPAQAREDLRSIARNVELEARLIDDLLDLTAISKGKVRLRTAITDAHGLVRQVVEIVKREVEAHHLQLVVRLEAGESHVRGDSVRLQQTLWNLVKNAIKFTPPGGTITIHSSNSAAGLLDLAVEDTGVGIEAKDLEHIFKPFEQVEMDLSARYGGLGLGLTIAKAIIDLHGGTLRATSAGRLHGAQFQVQLSTAPAPAGIVATGESPMRVRHHYRILLVDDHAQTLAVLARLLTRDGHTITTAESVATGQASWKSGSFDLLISDLGLPDGSGIDLLKSLGNERPIYAIALSGYGMEEDRRNTELAGFAAHIVKPVDIGQLREAIAQIDLPG